MRDEAEDLELWQITVWRCQVSRQADESCRASELIKSWLIRGWLPHMISSILQRTSCKSDQCHGAVGVSGRVWAASVAMLLMLLYLFSPCRATRAHYQHLDAIENPAYSQALFDVPWLASPNTSFSYTGLYNDLDGLLKTQAEDNWVTVMVYSQSVSRWTLNVIYSLAMYGKVHSYIVAAYDEASLADCQKWRLPCYNASWVVATQSQYDSTEFAVLHSHVYVMLVWGKVRLAQAVINSGVNLHFTDVDVVYFRPVRDSYEQLFKAYDVDAVFMHEAPMNTGVYAMRSSNVTIKFMEDWLAYSQVNSSVNDQRALMALNYQAYHTCASVKKCRELKICPSAMPNPCNPMRLYVHGVCTTWGPEGKGALWPRYNLWLVDKHGQPMWRDPMGRDPMSRDPDTQDASLPLHPYLPCQGLAWPVNP